MYRSQKIAITLMLIILFTLALFTGAVALENHNRLNELSTKLTMCKVIKVKPTSRVLECTK